MEQRVVFYLRQRYYGGVSLSDDTPTLRPSLPENTDRLTLRRLAYLGIRLSLEVNAKGIVLEFEALLEEFERSADMRSRWR